MFSYILDFVASIHTVILCRLHRIFCGLDGCIPVRHSHQREINWATLLIFASFEVLISKSVAQFFALIFAYIMELRKAVKNKISTISDSSHPYTQQQADGRKSSKDLVNTALSGYLNPLNKSAHPCEPPCHNRVIVSTLGLQGRKEPTFVYDKCGFFSMK